MLLQLLNFYQLYRFTILLYKDKKTVLILCSRKCSSTYSSRIIADQICVGELGIVNAVGMSKHCKKWVFLEGYWTYKCSTLRINSVEQI